MTAKVLEEIRGRVTATEGVENVVYVSKDDAAALFQEEFGENILDILDFNPLPASLKVSLKDGYKTSEHALGISRRLEGIKGVESVRYRKELLQLIDDRAASVSNLTLGLGLLISLSAIFLVSNTIRLAIYAKRHLIRTMELVGATRTFIRLPFLLEGIVQGGLGGIVASALLYSLLEYALQLVTVDFTDVIHREPWFYAVLLAAGCVLGLTGGMISVARFIRPATAS
jgi:cell division transport system permease protein